MSTPAIRFLERAKIEFAVHRYDAASLDETASYGEAVAAQLGISPDRLLKTLVVDVDGTAHVGIVPVSGSLDLKALAKAVGGKRAVMANPTDAERATGYVTGGISPFGQRKRLPVILDVSAFNHPLVLVSGGKRGLQIEVSPEVLKGALGARVAAIAG